MSHQHKSKTTTANISVTDAEDVRGLTRDRPWLLPSNRKLRHLQGISLRSLSLCPSALRPRGETIDDGSLPYALKTPAKALAQLEAPRLEHSRSSNDLKPLPLKVNGASDDDQTGSSVSIRPSLARGKLRRRSTLHWTSAPPNVRQDKLENVLRERMAKTWFSIHCGGIEDPVYISEVVEKTMNPNHRYFDLNTYGPEVTRRDELTIKYWAKTENMEEFSLLIELQLCLRSLQFIGKTLESFHHPLPQNCILLHLADGIYTSFTDLPLDEPVLPALPVSKHSQATQPTSSFDALMRLSNLDNCIQDALATRERLTSQISSLLVAQKRSLDTVNILSQAEEKLAMTKRYLTATRKSINHTQKRRSELQDSLKTRRDTISSGQANHERSQSDLDSNEADLTRRRGLRQEMKLQVDGQTRRICEDLLHIYSIEPFEQKPLCFTIRELQLPNAASLSSAESEPAVTAAALGHVAHIVYLLSMYLLTPIPYPPSLHGSTSTILDPISANMPSTAARTFPLYQKGAVTYRFEYGVFLLNSDIELLMSKQGSRMVDLRHTLPNLKYLLTVLATGKGELPVRRKAPIKGWVEDSATGDRNHGKWDTSEKGEHTNGKPPELRIERGTFEMES